MFGDAERVIISRNSKKERQYNGHKTGEGQTDKQWTQERGRTNRQTMVNKTLHRKLKNEQHECQENKGELGALEG
jgi:hypothetical protein